MLPATSPESQIAMPMTTVQDHNMLADSGNPDVASNHTRAFTGKKLL